MNHTPHESTISKLVGLVGAGGSGKDSTAAIFEKHGYLHLSSSDILREEIATRGLDTSRHLQTLVANEMREKFGAGYWLDRTLASPARSIGKIVISGLYAPGEGQYLQQTLHGILVGVVGVQSDESTYRRIVSRGDGSRDSLSWQEFLEANTRENSGDTPTGTNITKLLESANFIINNSSDLAHLQQETERIIELIEEEA